MVKIATHSDPNWRRHSGPAERGTLATNGVLHATTHRIWVAAGACRADVRRIRDRTRAGKLCRARRDLPRRAQGRRAAGQPLVLPHRPSLQPQMLVSGREGPEGRAPRGDTADAAGGA